ncbi:MAG: adenylate/guanylate cyclase domain-containing protein [Acidimicrobiales bacterium]|nr:adenylate/guanylate cyclase domain-containing protein [Acidimicrobiales bacterium]
MSEVLPRRPIKRVDRTFAFLDLCGFTAFTDKNGDTAAYDVVTGFRAAVRQVASERGVRLAKWLGDGVMMVGVQPEDLVEAVVDIEGLIDNSESPLHLRAGIARGPVMLIDGDDHVGPAVILASRLCDLAEPHQVLAEKGTAAPLMTNVEERSLAKRQVKGFEKKIEIVQLVPLGSGSHEPSESQ